MNLHKNNLSAVRMTLTVQKAGAEFIGAPRRFGMDPSGHSELQSHHELESERIERRGLRSDCA